jgi:hypothetical protein
MDFFVRFKLLTSTPETYLPKGWQGEVDWHDYNELGQPFVVEGAASFITAMWEAAKAADDIITAIVL